MKSALEHLAGAIVLINYVITISHDISFTLLEEYSFVATIDSWNYLLLFFHKGCRSLSAKVSVAGPATV